MKNIIFIATIIIASSGINLTAMEEPVETVGAQALRFLLEQKPELLSDQNLACLAQASRAFRTLVQRVQFEAAASNNKLDLPTRGLRYIMPGAFQNLVNLRELYLHNNRLNNLPLGIFENLRSLQGLSLGINRLENLPPGVFENLVNLRELYLQYNRLDNLPPGIFQNLRQLQRLDLSGNPLSDENKAQLRNALPNVHITF